MSPTPGKTPLRLMVLLAACTALGPLSLNVYLPGLPAVQARFAADLAGVQMTVSLALLAFGCGLVLLGPLADRLGRRPALLWGLVLFTAGVLLAATAVNIGVLTVGRMLSSLGAALTFISSRAVVADISPRDQLQRSVAQVTMIMLVGQMVAPILGNFVLSAGGWRAIQFALVGIGLLLLALAYRGLAETRRPELDAPTDSGGVRAWLGPVVALLGRAHFPLLLLQVGLIYSCYPAFIAIAPHLMIEAFHRPATEYGYYYAMLPAGYFLGNWCVVRFGHRLGQHRMVLTGAVVAVLACTLGLVLLTAGLWHPLTLFLTAGSLVNLGMGLALPSVSARAVGVTWPSTASGWGLVGFSQQLIAAICVQLLGFFASSSPFPVVWLCLALAAGALLMEMLPQVARAAHHALAPPE